MEVRYVRWWASERVCFHVFVRVLIFFHDAIMDDMEQQ